MRSVPETDRCVPLGTSATNEFLPMWGRSFGGIAREGPSIKAPKLARVAAGDHIQILKGMDAISDGYDWFEIEFNGRRGFQWGEIMRSEDPLPNVLAQCERLQASRVEPVAAGEVEDARAAAVAGQARDRAGLEMQAPGRAPGLAVLGANRVVFRHAGAPAVAKARRRADSPARGSRCGTRTTVSSRGRPRRGSRAPVV